MITISALQQPEETIAAPCISIETIFENYGPCVYGLILKSVNHDVTIAERLTAEAFTVVYKELHSFNPANARLFSWIYALISKLMRQRGYALITLVHNNQ